MFTDIKRSRWSTDHIAEHDVTLDEVLEALLNRPYLNDEGVDGSRLIGGKTDDEPILFVVAVADSPGVAFIVSAREMDAAEKKRFRRRLRQKGSRR